MTSRSLWRPPRRSRRRRAAVVTGAGPGDGDRASPATVDGRSDPPPPLPIGLRDPGFRSLFELYALRDWAWETMCHLPGPAEHDMLRRLDRAIARLEAEPLVADRSFEPVTHCPAGHVGTHFVAGEQDPAGRQHDDRVHVRRVCRYPACRVSWLEGR